MSRMIDADELLNLIQDEYSDSLLGEIITDEMTTLINAQPTVTQWIPCSRELPKEDGLYRVTVHPDYVCDGDYQVDDYYWKDGKWMYLDWCDFKLYGVDVEVIAWKPLEEPYQEP